MTGYLVNGTEYVAFSAAVAAAKATGAMVIDGKNGLVRWAPAALVSKARTVRYENQRAAYEAQQRAAARR